MKNLYIIPAEHQGVWSKLASGSAGRKESSENVVITLLVLLDLLVPMSNTVCHTQKVRKSFLYRSCSQINAHGFSSSWQTLSIQNLFQGRTHRTHDLCGSFMGSKVLVVLTDEDQREFSLTFCFDRWAFDLLWCVHWTHRHHGLLAYTTLHDWETIVYLLLFNSV